jgi:hypothetical protein
VSRNERNLSTAIQALKLSFVRRLQGIDDTSVDGIPRSRKISETWGTQHKLPTLPQYCSSNTIPAQPNLKAMKARIPSPTPCLLLNE